jgi:hypothetical protein
MLTLRLLAFLVAAATVGSVHAATAPAPSQKNLKPAVRKYLEEKGSFCLGKLEWPVAVSDGDRRARTSDSLQMPVLEKLGVVTVADAPADPTIKEYSLTETGRKYYLTRPSITVNAEGQKVRHPGDLCPAKLKLDKVVSWLPPTVVDGQTRTTVTYTYKVAEAAQWTQDPDVRKVFPMMTRILDSPGTQQLVQLFAWSGHGWVAIVPGESN